MKKLLMGAISLLIFASAVCILQVSCSKSNAQNTPLDNSQLNKIIFLKMPNPATGQTEVWTSNLDGSNASQIPIVLPTGVVFCNVHGIASVKLSPDGQTIVFTAMGADPTTDFWSALYSCNIDGTNVRQIVPGAYAAHVVLGGAY